MKFMMILKKIRQYFSKVIRLLGMFGGLSLVPFLWVYFMGGEQFYFNAYTLLCLVFFVLYYHSFIRLKTTYNDDIYARFLEELHEESTKREYLAFLFKQKNFWLQFVVTAVMFCILPMWLTVPVLAQVFGAYGNFGRQLLALCVFIPFLFVTYVVAHISAIDYWQRERGMKRDVSKKTKRNTYLSIMAAYTLVPFATLMLWSFFTQYVPLMIELWRRYPSPLLLVLVVFVILFAVFFNFFRVLLARKKFLKVIKRACTQKNFHITDIKHPYLSAFRVCKGESFQITTSKKTYSCKLVGAPKRGVPLAIHPMGGLHFMHSFRLFKTPIFSHTTVRDFGYDSELPKILIINPVPKQLFCHFGNKIEEIDNGALVGDYKIYTATAFIRAIETDTVERL